MTETYALLFVGLIVLIVALPTVAELVARSSNRKALNNQYWLLRQAVRDGIEDAHQRRVAAQATCEATSGDNKAPSDTAIGQ